MEEWRPTSEQQLKVALDVAKGMEYLHTRFQHDDSAQEMPIIHRDLKTPNLLLMAPPVEGEEIVVKIADFGLSRDKGLDSVHYQRTVMMTGCGSVLWMAPEILLGETYNEKIDVFSCVPCFCLFAFFLCSCHTMCCAQVRDVPGGSGRL